MASTCVLVSWDPEMPIKSQGRRALIYPCHSGCVELKRQLQWIGGASLAAKVDPAEGQLICMASLCWIGQLKPPRYSTAKTDRKLVPSTRARSRVCQDTACSYQAQLARAAPRLHMYGDR